MELDTGALYKKLSSKHDSCSKHQLGGSHKNKNQFLSILSIPLEQHKCNAVLEISIQCCSATVSFVKINAVQAILYFDGKSNVAHIFYIFIQLVQNLIQDMANKIYSLAMSSVTTGRMKTILCSGT
jgi:hypothetical protein